MEEIFVLLSDDSGTTRSLPMPFGYAVRSKAEAVKFESSNFSFEDTYTKVLVFDTVEEAMQYWKDNGRY